MKKILVILIIAGGAYAGYVKWSENQGKNTAAAPAAPEAAPAPVVTSHLAPAGTYYVTQRVSVTTSTGVVSVAPGTKVTLVKTNPDGMQVTDGENQFDVTPAQVTNDMDVVAHLPGQGSGGPALVKLDPKATYYLLQAVSVTTDSGVVGVPPGTKLTVVSITDDGARMTDGTNQFDVVPAQVTSDPAAARKALSASQAAQAQLASQIAAQENAHAQQAQQQAAASDAATPPPQAAEAPMGSSMDAAYDATQNKILVDQFGRHYWVDAQGKRHYVN